MRNNNYPESVSALLSVRSVGGLTACGSGNFINMKKPEFIIDLGIMYPTEKSNHKRRFGIYKCPICGECFKTQCASVASGNTRTCSKHRSSVAIDRFSTHGKSKTIL